MQQLTRAVQCLVSAVPATSQSAKNRYEAVGIIQKLGDVLATATDQKPNTHMLENAEHKRAPNPEGNKPGTANGKNKTNNQP